MGGTYIIWGQTLLADAETQHRKTPVDVYGSRLAALISPQNVLVEIRSSCWRDIILEEKISKTAEDASRILMDAISGEPAYARLRDIMEYRGEDFPVLQKPKLVIYPWQGKFKRAWTTHTFGVVNNPVKPGGAPEKQAIGFGRVFIDAATGEQLCFSHFRDLIRAPDFRLLKAYG